MNDTQEFKIWLEDHNNCVTLGEILSSRHSAEYRKHFSLLRKQGIDYKVTLNRKEPSKNIYTLKDKAVGSSRSACPKISSPEQQNNLQEAIKQEQINNNIPLINSLGGLSAEKQVAHRDLQLKLFN